MNWGIFWFNPLYEINVNKYGYVNCIHVRGGKLSFSLAGLNVRGCEVRNWECAMNILRGFQVYGLLVKIL